MTRNKAIAARGRLDAIQQQIKAAQRKRNDLKASLKVSAEEMQSLAEEIRLAKACAASAVLAQPYIEQIISAFVSTVMGQPHEFSFQPQVRAKTGEIAGLLPTITHFGINRPLKAFGGGVQNLVDIGARIAYILLSGTRRLLVMDEPAANLGQEYWERLYAALQQMSEQFEMQVIFISHAPVEFAPAIHVTRPAEISQATYQA